MTKSPLPALSIQASVSARNRVWARNRTTNPDQEVRPFNLSSFVAEDYTLYNGHPYVASLNVTADTVLSSEGEYAMVDRPSPFDVDLGDAQARFIASEASWDGISNTWWPYSTNGYDYSFTSSALTAPVLDQVDYRLGKEIISADSLLFPAGAYLQSSFNGGADDAAEYSVAMVLSLENPTPYDFFSGASGDDRLNIRLAGESLIAQVGSGTATVTPKSHPIDLIPLYVILTVKPGTASLWVGTSPQKIVGASCATKKNTVSNMRFGIGINQFGTAAATFRLMEWSLWPFSLNNTKGVHSIFTVMSKYASIYGAY